MADFDIRKYNPELDFQKIEDHILGLNPSLLKYEGFTNTYGACILNNPVKGIPFLIKHGTTHKTFDAKTNVFYCGYYANRTITDVFRLSKSYYPNLTIVDVYNILINCIGDNLVSWICKDIHKRTWYYKDYSAGFNSELIDEYNVTFPSAFTEGKYQYYGYGSYNGKNDLIMEIIN